MATSIFLISHLPVSLPELPSYRKILAGGNDLPPKGFLSDGMGENIANLNATYNEMTAIYWVYKHLDEFPDLDHVGFCHYRRYFCFDSFANPIYIRKDIQPEMVGVTQEKLASFFKEFDVFAPYPSYTKSVRRHYEKSHNKEDLDILLDVIAEIAPDYLPAYEQYIEGDEEYLYNMFVMSREDFKDYGDFIFPVLAEFAKRRPHKEDRLYVSERLTGAFLFYLKNQEKRILHLPLLLTRSRSLKAAFRQTKANFKEHPENGFLFKTKPLWLTLLPRWLEQRLRNRTRII